MSHDPMYRVSRKSEEMMNDESGEVMEPMEEMPLIRLRESELEKLVRGWWREAGS